MTTAPPNSRASLLAGLRTGGVRSTAATNSAATESSFNVPFNIPRFSSQNYAPVYPEQQEDQLLEAPQQHHMYGNKAVPVTAAVDGLNDRFGHQQRGMNPNSIPFSPVFQSNISQPQQVQQALQLQLLQLEVIKLQAIQAQQYQVEMLVRQQQQQQHQAMFQNRRVSMAFNPPATAAPTVNTFDLRSAAASAQARRANDMEQFKSQFPSNLGHDHVPMTAALGGKFGSRAVSLGGPFYSHPRYSGGEQDVSPPSPSTANVMSGGTPLSHLAPAPSNGSAPFKSDSASSWRRGGNNKSVLRGHNRFVSPPCANTTPPSNPRLSPAAEANARFRPEPLQLASASTHLLPIVTINCTDDEADGETPSSSSSTPSDTSQYFPTTPHTPIFLSLREEASKRSYEGLGIGRPGSTISNDGSQALSTKSALSHRMVSQPTRQPRGPPSGTEDLGPKNFATRLRRKAIGGLGVLMGARERREVEAF